MQDEDIRLILAGCIPADQSQARVPAYFLHIVEHGNDDPVGYIDIRIGDNEGLFYGGHIGYRVYEDFRGNSYAEKACRLVVPIAIAHGMHCLRITCNPDNLASKRTIEKLGARFIGIFPVPEYNDLYRQGDREKCVFEWDIK